jgi:hypothetical protein
MSDRQKMAPGTGNHDEIAAKPANHETSATVRWNQIVEWTDEDMARWRDAHKQPAHPEF